MTNIINPYRFSGSGFTPADLTDLVLWLDGSDGDTLYTDTGKTTPVASDGDNVGCWADKSGLGNDLTEATEQPIYRTNRQNSLSGLEFTNGDHLNLAADSADLFGSTTGFFAAVIKQTGASPRNSLLVFLGSNGSNYVQIWATYDNNIYFDLPNTSTGRVSASQPAGWDDTVHILDGYRSGANMEIRADGSSLATRADASGSLSFTGGNFRLGYNPVADDWEGDIYEFIACSTYPGSTERADLYSYLSAKWSV